MKALVPTAIVILLTAIASAAPPPPDLTDFRTWSRVTKNPFPMNVATAMICVGTPALRDAHSRKTSPEKSLHWNHYVHIYVNTPGKPSMQLHGPAFPEGSVIVKEKFPSNGFRQPDKLGYSTLLTVMRKREPGFDPQNGDWEYFTGDPKTRKLAPVIGKALKSCQSCHAHYKDRDFVTKAYLLTSEDITRSVQH